MLTQLQKHLLNDYQRDFPLHPRPYDVIAQQLGVTETAVIEAFEHLRDTHFLSRIGAIIPPNSIGTSCLVAMSVPAEQLHHVANQVSAYREVNHNYQREHSVNLWFVVIASHANHLETVIRRIEQETGITALRLPLIRDFFIDLGFDLQLSNDQ